MSKQNFKIILSVCFCLCFSQASLYAQQEVLIDLLPLGAPFPPSVRDASMGFGGVANGGMVQETFVNPASIGLMEQKLQTEFTYTTPAFVEQHAKNYYAGAGFKMNKKFTLAASTFTYYAKKPDYIATAHGASFAEDKMLQSYNTVTGSYMIVPGLYAGVNLTYAVLTLAPEKPVNSFFADLGLLYEKKLKLKEGSDILSEKLHFGASYSNLNAAKTHWQFPTGEKEDFHIASKLIAGACYSESVSLNKFVYGDVKLVPADARTIDFLAQVQYIKYISHIEKIGGVDQYAYLWGIGAGAEITILKLVSFRFGYRFERRVGQSGPFVTVVNYPYLKGFTFGPGLNLPLNHLTNGKCPFDLAFDFLHQKPFTFIKGGAPQKDYPSSNFSLRLNWILK